MRPMDKKDAVKLAGSQSNLARIFGITPQAVIQWPDGPLPEARLYELRGRRPEWFATSAAESAGAASTACTEVAA